MSTVSDTAVEFRTAIRDALDEELARDENVILFGEDIAVAGGVFVTTPGLAEKYGEARVFDTPISELALIGAAFGSAVTGKRPVIEIMFGDFLPLVMDGIVNQCTKYWYISNEQASVPLVVLSVVGAGGRFGAIHSQTPIAWFHSVPGLKIACPSTPADAKSLLKQAIRDDNPVLFLEHKRLLGIKGEVDGDAAAVRQARIARAGSDLTIVSVMKGVHDALAAAEQLAERGNRLRGDRPAHDQAARHRDGDRVGRAHDPPAGRRGRPAQRRLGRRGHGARDRAGARLARRRLAARHGGHADPVQPATRGRVPARARGDHHVRQGEERMNIASRGATMAVDWEQRIDFARLRSDRLEKARAALRASDVGALLLFDQNNIRYVSSTHIGEWARDKSARCVLLPREGDPVLWDFGSAAKHHQLYAPWLPETSWRAGVTSMRGAMPRETGVPDILAGKIYARACRARAREARRSGST